ncbi:hypothetical protein ANTPLA_LOCUS1148 [Anthophora plagiata]
MLVTSILLLNIFLSNNILAEWIDMPEFSNEKKVYRIPTTKQDHFYKFAQEGMENQFSHRYQNVSYTGETVEQATVNKSGEYEFYNAKDITEESNVSENTDKKNVYVSNAEKHDETTVPVIVNKEKEDVQYWNTSFISNDSELLKYLPVDVLKNVHHTLKSQPASSEGKIQFLKSFEYTLITEIESRLAESMADRKKRGVEHYDHGYDQEHAAGFPSIEGALMAISFLTFAVYLVRLVMLLFRNMNNSASTTTGATLLLGRRKKSINKFDDDAARILRSLHSVPSKF